MVWDLRAVNKVTENMHPVVPSPCTLLATLLPTWTWYFVLDLKDGFFCIPLASNSQEMFAFEW